MVLIMPTNREPGKYTLRVAYRVDPETREMMAELAERSGDGESAVFRRLVQEAHAKMVSGWDLS